MISTRRWVICPVYAPARARTTLDGEGRPSCPAIQTEDLVWALHGAGVETGVDLDALVETSVWMAGQLGRPSPSNVVRALAGA